MKSKNPMSRASAGRPGRSRHEIGSIIRQHRDSGLSLLPFVRQHRLPYPTLWGWRRRPDAMHSPHARRVGRTVTPKCPMSGCDPVDPVVQLTQAEAAFRTAMNDIELRPVFHQKAE